jgi:cobalt-zinc-cadmium efflux system protein
MVKTGCGILSLFVTTIYVDVAVALLITFFMVKTGWGIFVEGMGYFLQSAPEGFNYDDFEKEVKAVTGVSSVGDIHVWSQSATEHHLTCKVTITIEDACECDKIINAIEEICRTKFYIQHSTIQPVYTNETLQRFCKTI